MLWELLIEESALPADGEAFYKWLVESCENDEDSSSDIWKVKEIGELFNEKLGSGSKDFSALSMDGFLCIQSYFLLENEQRRNS
jgi:hypothetical protein